MLVKVKWVLSIYLYFLMVDSDSIKLEALKYFTLLKDIGNNFIKYKRNFKTLNFFSENALFRF